MACTIAPQRASVKYFAAQSNYASTVRVYISVDMEGIAGVVHESQTDPTDPACAAEYGRFRRLMTAEANAAVEGAVAAGATRVLVNDSHWFMRNLLAEELHQAAELVAGDPKPRSMVQGIDDASGFDAALFIGYHARAGTRNAILDHTYADRIHEVRLNGKPAGELALNAALAGVHGVPVALVSGDSALAAEAKDLLGDGMSTVVVKEAVSRHAARSVAPAVACRMIRDEVTRALQRKHAPFVLPAPIALEVDFAQTIHADMAELCPGATRTAGRTVAFSHGDYREVFRVWRVLLNLSAVV
jgi:D-amino peptidase